MLANKNFNHLLIIGVTISVTSISLLYNIDIYDSQNYETETYSSVYQFWFYLIYGISLGPILEEFIFDGVFLKHKAFKVLGVAGLIVLVFFVLDLRLINVAILFLFFILISLSKFFKHSSFCFILSLYVNAILFSVIHFKEFDLDSVVVLSFLSRFGGHLIALWLILNFNLFSAILYHILKNLLLTVIAYGIYDVNFHENQSDFEYIETSRFHIEYAETSLISKHSIKYRDTLWQCKSCEFKDFYNYLSFDDEANIQQKDKRKYDINIKIKNNQDKTRSEILEDLHNVLKSNELIKVREE